jgi:hypothetical protein
MLALFPVGTVVAEPGAYNFNVSPTPGVDKLIVIGKNQSVWFSCAPAGYQGKIDSYFWEFPNSDLEVSDDAAPGLVTFNENAEGKHNWCTFRIGHTDENSTPCSNPMVNVADVVVPKIELDAIDILGGGSSPVAVNGTIATGKTPRVDVYGTAKITPSSTAIDNALQGRLKIYTIQNCSGIDEIFFRSGPHNGAILSTGGYYVYDGGSNTSTNILGGKIGGAYYFDEPRVGGDIHDIYRATQHLNFLVYLRYQLDNSEWKTIGVRTWSVATDIADSSNSPSGSWVGNAVATIGPPATPSDDEPELGPIQMNNLPWLFY